uniref:tRNA pseudouridine synthase D (TruD) putative n=1 Tax=Albugo laibachii Nc14 TaxID=890382 RepID=F0W8Q0_9STRA|nr:tRNA pseudouridine synthase D (TruD) putative [Albugo laibachii Nc14]|eukprot:CCA17507.1 tRNA pseudouridine synthase D (TruD) putative [Albugo laibachii Nc14]
MKPQARGRHTSKRGKFARNKTNQVHQRAPLASFRGPGYNDGAHVTLDESKVGIQCYRCPNIAGFTGIMKQRYSDFIVREVDTNGAIVSLTELSRNSTPSTKTVSNPKTLCELLTQTIVQFLPLSQHKSMETPINTLVKSIFASWKSLRKLQRETTTQRKIKEVQDLITTELNSVIIAGQMTQFLHKMLHTSGTNENSDFAQEVFLFSEVKDKAARTRIHQTIRTRFGHAIVSDTIANKEGVSVIRLRRLFVSGKKRKDVDRREANRWDKDRPEFLEFTLYKRNMDTNVVMASLARAIRCRVSNFGFAGTKDKRGVTTQRCTLYHGSKEQLERLNRLDRSLDEFNFLVGNTRFVPEKLKLGDLNGNHFSITIRDVCSSSETVLHDAISAWKEHGYINYFGLQRFGTRSIPTHEIGQALLRQNFKEAIDLIMRPQSGDPSKIRQAREKFQQQRDVQAALLEFPPYLVAERAILEGLERHGTNALGQAVQCIPRPLRMMYTHSYQSYVWNRAVSERLTKFSSEHPILGDLALPSDFDLVDEEVLLVDLDDAKVEKRRKSEREVVPVVITEENQNQYRIQDVVLPLPGYDIKYPQNPLLSFYEILMASENVDFQKLTQTMGGEYHLPGSYRHLIRRAKNVEYEIKRYDDPSIALLPTDVDKLQERSVQASIPDGKMVALCLQFELGTLSILSPPFFSKQKPLGRSSYATIAIRDLMKQQSNCIESTCKPETSVVQTHVAVEC